MIENPDDTGFVDGHREEIVNFDFGAIDELLAEESANPKTLPDLGDGLNAILCWIWKSQTGTRSAPAAFRRFAAMTAALNPEILGDKSYREIGQEVGITRAMVSKHALEFQKHFGVHFRRSRREGAREAMRESRRQYYARRKQANPPN